MELKICNVLGHQRQAPQRQALCLFRWQNRPWSIACVGAGAVSGQAGSSQGLECDRDARFYFQAPSTWQETPHSPDSSPHGSKLVRVNKSSCVDASPDANLVALGEDGGYLPRLMLFNLSTAACLDVVQDVHQYGVKFLRFSPSGRSLVSMGTPQDGFVYVWSVDQGLLSLHSSNRCISDVRDLFWLNDTQFVSVGVRHIRIWTTDDGSILNGRNVVLGPACDQTFECGTALPDRTSFLVGTTKGSIFSMPEPEELICDGQKPVLSIALSEETCLVNNSTHIIEYSMDSGKLLRPKTWGIGSKFIIAVDNEFFMIPIESHRAIKFPPNPQKFDETDDVSRFLERKHLQVSSRLPGKSSVSCWNEQDGLLLRWPNELIETSLLNITVADCTTSKACIAGSLSGDIWLDGKYFNAHNGPVTDVSFLDDTLAISSGRDRSIQIWARSQDWYLKQTLLFSTPILKAQLLTCSSDKVSLVCCGANKTVYIYTASSSVDVQNETAALFDTAPRTLQLKGMPFDLTIAGTCVAISTNDKLVSIIDPWAEQKVETTWRPVTANGDSVNLTRILAVENSGSQYIVGAASNKSVLVFGLQRGDCVASQWGHGEPISSLAWLENKIFSTSDTLIVSDLTKSVETGETLGSPPRLQTSSPLSAPSHPKNDPPVAKLKLSSSPTASRSASPLRKVFDTPNRSRSSSPLRSPPRQLARSPSPPPRSQTKSPTLARGRPSSAGPSAGPNADMGMPSLRQPNLSYRPLRLSDSAYPAPSAEKDVSDNLMSALEAFLKSPHSDESKNPILKSHLLSALQKVDGLAFVDEVSNRLSQQLCKRVEAHLTRSFNPN